jgi:hypothetical protein
MTVQEEERDECDRGKMRGIEERCQEKAEQQKQKK